MSVWSDPPPIEYDSSSVESTPSKLRERKNLASPSSHRGVDQHGAKTRFVLGKDGPQEVSVSEIDMTLYPSNIDEEEQTETDTGNSGDEPKFIVATRRNSAKVRLETDATRHPFMFDMLPIAMKGTYNNNFYVADIDKPTHVCNGTNSCIFTAVTKKNGKDFQVIIKKVANEAITNELALTEFYRERELLSRLSHANIVDIVGSGKDSSVAPGNIPLPFLVLEYLDGGSLSAYLAKQRSFHTRPFKYPRFLELARQFADALQYLHYGVSPDVVVIHRDLKPDNLSFTTNGVLKILDFGLSICVKRGGSDHGVFEMTGNTGSLRYMAPEVAKNLPYNEKADVYSYAIVVYQMLTGVAPFAGLKRGDFFHRVVKNGETPPLNMDDYGRAIHLDMKLRTMLARCWSRDIDERPSSKELNKLLVELVQTGHDSSRTGSDGAPPECCIIS